MKNPLNVLQDKSERLAYNLAGFPVYTKVDKLSRYGWKALCHWHPDLEFIRIVDGAMDYFVNGKVVRLQAGQGIFVNSRRLHYGFSDSKNECTFQALVIHPDLFTGQNSRIQEALKEKFGVDNEDYVVLYPHVPWHKEVLQMMETFVGEMEAENCLHLLSLSVAIASLMADHIESRTSSTADIRQQDAFLAMTDFVHHHYGEKITLDAIAQAGSVCRSRACELFQTFVRQSPTTYVRRYRAGQASILLRDTELSITEIAGLCGYGNASYFSSQFRQETGLTPAAFRKQNGS